MRQRKEKPKEENEDVNFGMTKRFNLVVGSLLSPLDLCNTPTYKKIKQAVSPAPDHVDNSTGTLRVRHGQVWQRSWQMYMKLGSKFLNAFRVKTWLVYLNALVCDSRSGATHSQKDGMEGNGGSLKIGAEAFVLFLRGA